MWWRLTPVLFSFAVVLNNRLTLSLNRISGAVRHFLWGILWFKWIYRQRNDTMVIFVADELMRF